MAALGGFKVPDFFIFAGVSKSRVTFKMPTGDKKAETFSKSQQSFGK
jgi:hypothetical protein